MDRKIKEPVFVVGCGKSGTSLFFKLLAQNPILVPTDGYPDGEDHDGWIKYGKCVMAGLGNIHHNKYKNGINGFNACLPMTEIDATDSIIQSMHEHYFENVLKEDTSQRIINKNIHISNKLQYLFKIFPDAKVVHIIRNPINMLISWKKTMDLHQELVAYWPKHIKDNCFWLLDNPKNSNILGIYDRYADVYPGSSGAIFFRYWLSINSYIFRMKEKYKNQIISLSFESFIKSPAQILNKASHFCGLPSFQYNVEKVSSSRATNTSFINLDEFEPDLLQDVRRLARKINYSL
ncbi:sulfotransferase [Synechococcus sp. AH-551-A10]|nr:sulfotransferase [Synechococcus sp. AH-551-A10]MDB4682078.1 sulfotransferase [Synechococcus sp. AH-551-A10]